MIYLAIPYTHNLSSMEQARFSIANLVASHLMKEGIHVYSPISHSHPIRMEGGLPGTWEYWEKHCRKILSICDKVFVVCIPGWEDSHGVQEELKIAKELGLPIIYFYHPLSIEDVLPRFSEIDELVERLKA